MKKLKKPITTFLPRAKIFLDDVEKIEEILKESCSSYNITLNDPKLDLLDEIQKSRKLFDDSYSFYTIELDEEYELGSVNEINEIKEIVEKQDFHNLKITLTKPYFKLYFDQLNTLIYCDDDSLCIGITERIKPIVQKRKTFFQLRAYIFIYFLEFLLAIVLLIDVLMNLYSDLISWMLIGTSILLSIITSKLILFKDDNSKFIVFTTIKSNEKTNFFIKNKDPLILTVISASIIALLGTFFKFILTGQ